MSHPSPQTSLGTRAGLVVAGATALGVLANISGVVGFGTGKSAPELFGHSPQTSPAAPGNARSSDAPSPTATPSVSPSALPTPTPESPNSQPSTSAAPRTPSTAGALPLSSLTPVASKGDVTTGTTVMINRRAYDGSILYACSLCDGDRGEVEYTIPGGVRSFHATVGVTDDAEEGDQVGTFQVWVDRRLVRTYRSTLGKPATVSVPLPSGIRLRLVAFRPGTEGDPLKQGVNAAGGVSNGPPSLAWGAPSFRS